jgi:hypothetical protein
VAARGAVTIADASVQNGLVGLHNGSSAPASFTFGGTGLAGTCIVTGPAPAGWNTTANGWATSQEPAFCWTQLNAFNGVGSLSCSVAAGTGNTPTWYPLTPLGSAIGDWYSIQARSSNAATTCSLASSPTEFTRVDSNATAWTQLQASITTAGSTSYNLRVWNGPGIGYFDMARITRYAGVAADLSTGNHPGAASGIITQSAGALVGDAEAAATLDGITAHISAAAALPAAGRPYTLSGWAKLSNLGQTGAVVEFIQGSNASMIWFNGASWVVRLTDSTGGVHDFTGAAGVVGAWYHLVLVYNGSALNLYVNGALQGVGLTGLSSAAGSGPLLIGSRAADLYFPGSIQEVAIWAAALNATQVRRLYNIGMGTAPASGITQSVPGALPGDTDTAMTFDGLAGYISVPYTPALNPPGQVSVEYWVQVLNLVRPEGQVRVDSSGFTNKGYRSTTPTGGTQVTWIINPGAGQVSQTSANLAAGWHHFVGTNDGVSSRLYIDGVLAVGPTAAVYVPSNDGLPLMLGANSGGSQECAGTVDEFAVYGYALTAAQVLNHYNAGKVAMLAARAATLRTRDGLLGLRTRDGLLTLRTR